MRNSRFYDWLMKIRRYCNEGRFLAIPKTEEKYRLFYRYSLLNTLYYSFSVSLSLVMLLSVLLFSPYVFYNYWEASSKEWLLFAGFIFCYYEIVASFDKVDRGFLPFRQCSTQNNADILNLRTVYVVAIATIFYMIYVQWSHLLTSFELNVFRGIFILWSVFGIINITRFMKTFRSKWALYDLNFVLEYDASYEEIYNTLKKIDFEDLEDIVEDYDGLFNPYIQKYTDYFDKYTRYEGSNLEPTSSLEDMCSFYSKMVRAATEINGKLPFGMIMDMINSSRQDTFNAKKGIYAEVFDEEFWQTLLSCGYFTDADVIKKNNTIFLNILINADWPSTHFRNNAVKLYREIIKKVPDIFNLVNNDLRLSGAANVNFENFKFEVLLEEKPLVQKRLKL